MKKEVLTDKQAISLMVLSLTGSSFVVLPGMQAGRDVWISKIMAIILILPFMYIYNKLMDKFPHKSLFDIFKIVFGKVLGNIINVLYIWYFFYLGVLELRIFGDIIQTVSIPETPIIFPVIFVSILCMVVAKYGIEVMGNWCETIIIVIATIIIVTVGFLVKDMDIDNLRPVLYDGWGPVLKGTILIFSFPYGESIIFTAVFTNIIGKHKSKVYFLGTLIQGIMGIIVYLSTILTIGDNLARQSYFPGFIAISHVNVGNFIQRVDIVVPLVFIFGGVIKTSMCILVSSKGIANVFNFKDYNFIIMPITFIMFSTFILNFQNIFQSSRWIIDIYPMYSIPFQVIFPILLYVTMMVKGKFNKA